MRILNHINKRLKGVKKQVNNFNKFLKLNAKNGNNWQKTAIFI
jgi:hypothetical protein